jgi:hypothetical protein
VLVHAASVRRVGATVLIFDRAADNGLGEETGEQERQCAGDCPRQEPTYDQTPLHTADSVAGEAKQMACVVDELVHV